MAYMFVVFVPVNENAGAQNSKGNGSSVHNSLYGIVEDVPKPGIPVHPKAANREIVSCEMVNPESLEVALQEVLKMLNIKTDSWIKSQDETHWQVSFLVEREDTDHVLQQLCNIGIGNSPNSSVSIFLANYHRSSPDTEDNENNELTNRNSEERNDFIKSVKARLTVAQVVEAVKCKSTLTFDYIMFTLISSLISVFGLVENNPVIVIVSILVSPLMGPILAALFGTVIRVWGLFKLGARNEVISLLLCLGVGFVFGLIITGINHDGLDWNSDTTWPSQLMKNRGIPRSIWVGMLISIPSGAGVALALLGGSTSPLVGVVVSASLLGPVVNAGILFGCALVYGASPPPVVINVIENNYTTIASTVELSPPNCPDLQNNKYEQYYSCNMGLEAFLLGLVSLSHTLIDIICIFVTGVLVLKIKEVAPHTTKSKTFDMFWKSDVKIARKEYKKKGSFIKTEDVARQIEAEEKERRISVLPEIVLEIEEDNRYQQIADSLPEKPPDLDVVLGSDSRYSSPGHENQGSQRRTSEGLSMSRRKHCSWLSVRRSKFINTSDVILETEMPPQSRPAKLPKKEWIQESLTPKSSNMPV